MGQGGEIEIVEKSGKFCENFCYYFVKGFFYYKYNCFKQLILYLEYDYIFFIQLKIRILNNR